MESFHLGGVWGRRFGLAKPGRVFVEKFKDLLCGEAACAQGAHRLGAKHRRRKAVALELWRRKLQINKSTRFFLKAYRANDRRRDRDVVGSRDALGLFFADDGANVADPRVHVGRDTLANEDGLPKVRGEGLDRGDARRELQLQDDGTRQTAHVLALDNVESVDVDKGRL